MNYELGNGALEEGVPQAPGRLHAAIGGPAVGRDVVHVAGEQDPERMYAERDDFIDFSRQAYERSDMPGVRAFSCLADAFKHYIRKYMRDGVYDKEFPLRFEDYPRDTLAGKWSHQVGQLDVYSLRDYVRQTDKWLKALRVTDTSSEVMIRHAHTKLPYIVGINNHRFYRKFVLDKLGPDAFDTVNLVKN